MYFFLSSSSQVVDLVMENHGIGLRCSSALLRGIVKPEFGHWDKAPE